MLSENNIEHFCLLITVICCPKFVYQDTSEYLLSQKLCVMYAVLESWKTPDFFKKLVFKILAHGVVKHTTWWGDVEIRAGDILMGLKKDITAKIVTTLDM